MECPTGIDPGAEMECPTGIDPGADTQQLSHDTFVTEESTVEEEATEGQKIEFDTQEHVNVVVVTQEPTTKMEQPILRMLLHPQRMLHIRKRQTLKQNGVQRKYY